MAAPDMTNQATDGQTGEDQADQTESWMIRICYSDGSSECVEARIVPNVIAANGGWRAGFLVKPPMGTQWSSDFFEAAINEGGLTAGSMEADPDTASDRSFAWLLLRRTTMTGRRAWG